ncbi:MAG TPA: hypothetical protein PKB14_20690 [Rubrivivax sp.]|nr:hypothetical protein [Rubrivivax sp.]
MRAAPVRGALAIGLRGRASNPWLAPSAQGTPAAWPGSPAAAPPLR